MNNLGKLLTVYGIEASILTETPDTFAPLADGIDNIAEALNEVVQQYFFLKDKGFATNHVTGMAPAYTLAGRRVVGDAAQDYIFSKKFSLDTERQTKLRIVYTDAEDQQKKIECPCTICNIQEYSGASTDDSAISFELRMDGKPTVGPNSPS